MSRAVLTLLAALCVAPAVACLIYRLAHRLGFLEPPADNQLQV